MEKDRAKFGPEYGDRFCMLQLVGRHEMDKVTLQRESDANSNRMVRTEGFTLPDGSGHSISRTSSPNHLFSCLAHQSISALQQAATLAALNNPALLMAAGTHPSWLNSLSAHLGLINPAAMAGMLNPALMGGTQLMPLHHHHAMAAAAAGAPPTTNQMLDAAAFAQLQMTGGSGVWFFNKINHFILVDPGNLEAFPYLNMSCLPDCRSQRHVGSERAQPAVTPGRPRPRRRLHCQLDPPAAAAADCG